MAALIPPRVKAANTLIRANFIKQFTSRCSSLRYSLFYPGHGIARSSSIVGNHQALTAINACSNQASKQFINLLDDYEHQVKNEKLLFDPLQQHAARRLTRLQMALKDYDHASFLEQLQILELYDSDSDHQRQTTSDEQDNSPPTIDRRPPPNSSIPIPRGFYIHGNVGTGKSLLLNKFYNSAPTPTSSKKRRLHFHSFLQDIHQRIHELNKQLLQKNGRSFHVDTCKKRNPILQVAKRISEEVSLLCIDEFQVTDVADAMILSQFFGELWRRGVVVVATSNRHPRDLYEDGLNRGYFLPFLDLLEKYCVVHHLGGSIEKRTGSASSDERDYRRIRSGVDVSGSDKCGDYFYLTRNGNEQCTSQQLDELFQSFQSHTQPINGIQPLTLPVQFQRTISISRYHLNTAARFTFDELCTAELGSSDYRAIAENFQVVFIESLPQLTLKDPDRARRFIILIDELYEAGCCLVCSAVDIPDRLFIRHVSDIASIDGGEGAVNLGDSAKESSNIDAVDVAKMQGMVASELASVKELSFAFGRAASRILEMCSKVWWKEKGAVL